MPSWKIDGEYFENCNCDVLCPCITSNLQRNPTHGEPHSILGPTGSLKNSLQEDNPQLIGSELAKWYKSFS